MPVTINAPCVARAFRKIEAAAVAGLRAPTRAELGCHDAVTALLRAQHIMVEVYPRNYRVITVLVGPNAGKKTAPPPNESYKPYKVLTQTSAKAYVPKHGGAENSKIAP